MNAPYPRATEWHPHCIACGLDPGGLNLRFALDGRDVVATFDCTARYQGYPGRLHGGIIATLVDAAMTHRLFSRDVMAYTASLEIRYRRPVLVGPEAAVRARLREAHEPVYVLEAEVLQEGRICATARAKFMAPQVSTEDRVISRVARVP